MNNELKNIETQNSQFATIILSDFSLGYPILKFVDALKQNYSETEKRKNKIRKNLRMYDDVKKERIEKLNAYEAQLRKNFEICSTFIKKWVAQFPAEDKIFGDILMEYILSIDSSSSFDLVVREKLQITSSNFLQKVRAIVIKMEETGMSKTR